MIDVQETQSVAECLRAFLVHWGTNNHSNTNAVLALKIGGGGGGKKIERKLKKGMCSVLAIEVPHDNRMHGH